MGATMKHKKTLVFLMLTVAALLLAAAVFPTLQSSQTPRAITVYLSPT
jgi:hypothetical protein